MKSRLIDPRDANLEDDVPTYRVYFWADDASGKEEWELSETDLDDVLQWIPQHSNGRSHSLWAVTRDVVDRGEVVGAPPDHLCTAQAPHAPLLVPHTPG